MTQRTRLCSLALIAVASLASLLAPAPAAFAQDFQKGVSLVRHHAAGWTFSPAILDGRVIGFLAWADAGVGAPGNITTIWFARGPKNAWTISGWTGDALGGAVQYVRETYQSPALFSHDGLLVRSANFALEAAKPEPMVNGFFAADPLATAVSDGALAASIAGVVADDGYPVAGGDMIGFLRVGTVDPCPIAIDTVDLTLVLVSRAVEVAAFGEAAQDTLDAINAINCSWPCDGCTTTYGNSTPTPPGTWTTTMTRVGQRCKCESRRPSSAPATYSGETWFWCDACTGPATVTGEDYFAEDIECPGPCPAPSGSGVFVP